MSVREGGWVKLPLKRAIAWSTLSGYVRAMGTELFRAHQETELPIAGADWKLALARSLELDGRDRPPFFRALDEMIGAGVLVVTESSVRLLYTAATLAAHRRHNTTALAPHQFHNDGTTEAHPTHDESASQPQLNATERKDSDHPSQRDREKERKREREAGSVHAPEVASIERRIRLGYAERYSTARSASPPQSVKATEARAQLTAWVRDTAALRKVDALGFAEQLLDAFFASPKAAQNGFAMTWLAANPLEFLEPVLSSASADLAVDAQLDRKKRRTRLDQDLATAQQRASGWGAYANLTPEQRERSAERAKLITLELKEFDAEVRHPRGAT